jgi:hypothetical protein
MRRDSLSGQRSALGLAIMVAIASAHIFQAENNGIGSIDALNDGFHLAFIGAAIVAAVAADVAFVAVKKSSGSSQKERQQWERARIFPGQKTGLARLSSHPSTFFGAAAACLRAFLAMIYVMSFTFLSASIANVGAQSAKLLCKLAVH